MLHEVQNLSFTKVSYIIMYFTFKLRMASVMMLQTVVYNIQKN